MEFLCSLLAFFRFWAKGLSLYPRYVRLPDTEVYDTLHVYISFDVTRVATVVSTLSVIYISRVFFFFSFCLFELLQGFGYTRRHTSHVHVQVSGGGTFFLAQYTFDSRRCIQRPYLPRCKRIVFLLTIEIAKALDALSREKLFLSLSLSLFLTSLATYSTVAHRGVHGIPTERDPCTCVHGELAVQPSFA